MKVHLPTSLNGCDIEVTWAEDKIGCGAILVIHLFNEGSKVVLASCVRGYPRLMACQLRGNPSQVWICKWWRRLSLVQLAALS